MAKLRAVGHSEAEVRDQMFQAMILMAVGALVLLLIGVTMVYSATAPSAIRSAQVNGTAVSYGTAIKQVIYAVIGVAMAVGVSFMPLRWFLGASNAIFVAALLLQTVVLTPLGVSVAGNTNWIRLGPVQIQPSEFLKLATIVWLAVRLGSARSNDWSPSAMLAPSWLPWFKGISPFPPIFGAVAAITVVLLGGDLGTGLVFGLVTAGMLWLAGMPKRYFVWSAGLVAFGLVFLVTMSPSRLTRIKDFFTAFTATPDALNPTQSDFALWAFGSGGLSGTGPGTSVEKWPGNLAEAQTDYIFAVIGEEFGMLGCLVVLVMFGVLGYGLLKIAIHHPDRRARLACGGIAIWLCGQAIANMFVVTGLLPVFGVPLPFVSQGGSAVIACLLAVGFGLCCAMSVDGMRDSLRQRARLARRAQAVVKGA